MSDELDRLELRARLHGELDELAITGPVRDEMTDDPEAALRLVDRARRARGIRNPAAFLIAQWRARRAPPAPPPRPAEPEIVEGPPDLDTLEHAWSLSPPVASLVLKLLGAAIEKHGGYQQLRADFERRRQ